jgi:hypothetical protein
MPFLRAVELMMTLSPHVKTVDLYLCERWSLVAKTAPSFILSRHVLERFAGRPSATAVKTISMILSQMDCEGGLERTTAD